MYEGGNLWSPLKRRDPWQNLAKALYEEGANVIVDALIEEGIIK